MNFPQGRSGTKVQFVNRACFPKDKHQNSQKGAKFTNFSFWPFLCQGLLNGGVSNGGVSRSGLVLPFLSFFIPFQDFPDFSGIFPICSGMVRGFSRFALFLFLGLSRAPTRNSPERVRDTIWTFPEKSGKPPGLETTRFSFSQFLVWFAGATPELRKRGGVQKSMVIQFHGRLGC